ncbi:hypothetical protein [Leptotrichia sp. oral taxon 498]|uniref:hypothetical protein n=1 Tax=Leptotrichia sp. oral taxon 498 TaxID=712368 RepID=UPI00155FCE56|nr:hypothetical protein [Leptotrichia sp. oral taxon 498]
MLNFIILENIFETLKYLMAIITGLWIYWIISHIIGTVKFLKNEDYSYKFSANILKP